MTSESQSILLRHNSTPSLDWQRRGWFSTIAPAISQFYLGTHAQELKDTAEINHHVRRRRPALSRPRTKVQVHEQWLNFGFEPARPLNTSLGTWIASLLWDLPGKTNDSPDDLDERLSIVREIKDVMRIHDPIEKWTDLGLKLHWRLRLDNRTMFRK